MNKHKIDKLFSEKLKDHKTPPADKVWDTLAEELGETPHSRIGMWWWKVAAVVLLCLSAGVWIYQEMDANKTLLVQQEAQPAVNPDEQPAQSEQETKVTENKTDEASLPVLPEKNEASQIIAQQQAPAVKKQQKQQIVSETPVAEQPVRSVERLETIASIAVNPSEETAIENTDLPEQITEVVATVRTPVKIIYKGDAAPKTQEEEDQKDNKFFEVVKDIKNGELGLAELRDAKSELLASAFAKLKDKREQE